MNEHSTQVEKFLEDHREITSLNLEELDVEELEQRLELSSATPNVPYCLANTAG